MPNEITVKTGQAIYEQYAHLLDYPDANYCSNARELSRLLTTTYPEAGYSLSEFIKAVETFSLDELEEIFTRTFDIAPICVPYLSSYAFGEESFERGDLMAKLKGAYVQVGFEVGNELPDHIRVILCFLATLKQEDGVEFARYVLIKPLCEMRDRLSTANSPFAHLMSSIIAVIKADFPLEDNNG